MRRILRADRRFVITRDLKCANGIQKLHSRRVVLAHQVRPVPAVAQRAAELFGRLPQDLSRMTTVTANAASVDLFHVCGFVDSNACTYVHTATYSQVHTKRAAVNDIKEDVMRRNIGPP